MSPHTAGAAQPGFADRLEFLARQLDAATDFWTTICLSPELPAASRRSFVQEQCHRLEARLAELRLALAGGSAAPPPGLAELEQGARQLGRVFEVLAEYRDREWREVKAAVHELLALEPAWRSAVERLSRSGGHAVAYWDGLSPEQRAYRSRIRDSLESLFLDGLSSPEPRS